MEGSSRSGLAWRAARPPTAGLGCRSRRRRPAAAARDRSTPVLVIRQQERRALPVRRFAEAGDQLFLNPHPDRDVGRRMLVPAPREARDHPGHLGQLASPQVVEVLTAARPCPVVVRVLLPEDEDVVRIPEGNAVPADVVDLPGYAGRVQQVSTRRSNGREAMPAGRPRVNPALAADPSSTIPARAGPGSGRRRRRAPSPRRA